VGLLNMLVEDSAIILATGALVSTLLCSRTVSCWWDQSYCINSNKRAVCYVVKNSLPWRRGGKHSKKRG